MMRLDNLLDFLATTIALTVICCGFYQFTVPRAGSVDAAELTQLRGLESPRSKGASAAPNTEEL